MSAVNQMAQFGLENDSLCGPAWPPRRRGNGAPVPAQASAPAKNVNGLYKPAGSTQHEGGVKTPLRRKPGQAKQADDTKPPF